MSAAVPAPSGVQEPAPPILDCSDTILGQPVLPESLCAEPSASGPASPPTGAQVAQRVLNSFRAPQPVVVMSPRTRSYVNLKTWLAVESWGPLTATATLSGISSTITGVPQRVTWEMGPPDGTVVCNGPGDRYDPSVPDEWQDTDCGYTYRWSSAGVGADNAYSARVTVTYHVTWSSTDGTSGVIGPVSAVTTFSVPVAEVQALNTVNRYGSSS